MVEKAEESRMDAKEIQKFLVPRPLAAAKPRDSVGLVDVQTVTNY